jgi:hypothetical protein
MRTHAETLRSIAERNGWIGDNPTSMGSWWCKPLEGSRETQLESYLVESLHCTLTHREPLIALRAWGQACAYLAELRGKIGGYGMYSDMLGAARNRLETLLRPLVRFPE